MLEIEKLTATFQSGRLLREGLRITLVGRPNVGKSSVFNKLASADRAIVTDIPGTTRDSLNEAINLQGVPVLLTDTAGVRASTDRIESLGMERTRRAMADADLLILVLDGSMPLTCDDREVMAEVAESPHIIALNKSDLSSFRKDDFERACDASPVIAISAKTGAGLDELRAAILKPFDSNGMQASGLLITDARHFDLLRRAQQAILSSNDLLEQRASEELVLVDLYNALRFLGEITGETTPEDVLSQIFATFCIGK
jgi:tRNA modification GTPase